MKKYEDYTDAEMARLEEINKKSYSSMTKEERKFRKEVYAALKVQIAEDDNRREKEVQALMAEETKRQYENLKHNIEILKSL